VPLTGRWNWRVFALGAVFALFTLGIVARLVYLQVLRHDHYQAEARAEHLEKREVRSSRGAILDRSGFPLVISRDVFDVYVDRRAWKSIPNASRDVAFKLAPFLSQQAPQLQSQLDDASQGPITLLSSGVEFDVGKDIDKMHLPGIVLASATKRAYPEGDIASPILGFLGREHTGLAGLEGTLDDVLSGTPGALYFEQDGGGNPIAFGQSRVVAGTPGSDVRLTLDRYLQKLIEGQLDIEIKAHQASGGTILIMDPKTGAIMAMASRPSFKLSDLDLDNPDFSLYRERAVTDLYEPGSVIKTITMSSAIDLGLVTPDTTYLDTGLVVKGGYEFKNWDFSANGIQTMTQVLQKSLNTGAI